ncbi:MAG: hypothetical protein E7473_02025 [Ruminococcaceae bacterium]|nr:hypothetical protein [Oscillospiraceae bacterium]
MKKFISSILVIIMLVSSFGFASANEGENAPAFSGTREIDLYIDASDMENFISGGRSGIELIVRQYTPSGINCRVFAENRDVHLAMSFDFNSVPDYCNKLQSLVGNEPTVIYNDQPEVFLMESCSVFDMLNFISEQFEADGYMAEKGIEELFKISSNKITLNSKSYETEESIMSIGNDKETYKLSILSISATADEHGGFSCEILCVPEDGDDNVAAVRKSLESVGTPADAENYYGAIAVTFSADSHNDLQKKLMLALGVVCASSEDVVLTDEKTETVTRKEYIDVAPLFEYSPYFTYTIDFGSYYRDLSIWPEEGVSLDGSVITVTNTPGFTYSFNRGISFSSVCVNTDLSDIFGKIKRTIKFELPIDIAQNCHTSLKDELSKKLDKGCFLNIYDENSMRYYEIGFETYSDSEVEEFTGRVLGGTCVFKIDEGFIPLAESKITDSIDSDSAFGFTIPTEMLTSTYTLPPMSFFTSDTEIKHKLSVSDNTLVVNGDVAGDFSFTYRTVDVLKSSILLIIIIVLIIAFFVIRRYLRKRKKTAPEAVPEATSEAVPEAVPEATSEAVPEVAPEAVPEVAPEAVPEVAPEAVPEVAPEAVPEVAPEAVPEAVPEATPEAVPEAAPEAVPEAAPEAVPEAAPEAVPEATSEAVSEATPEPKTNDFFSPAGDL